AFAAGGGERVTAFEHREGGWVAHDRAPDAEQTVRCRGSGLDVRFDIHASDDPAALALREVGLGRSESEFVPARQQHAARENLRAAAPGRRPRDRYPVA